MTNAGVSDHNGIGKFYSDEAFDFNEWGSGILPPKIINIAKETTNDETDLNFQAISVIRLSDFLKNIVSTRKIPESSFKNSPPKVVMKMDIEGSEVDVIPDLIFSGGFQYIDTLMMEWHGRLQNIPERQNNSEILKGIVESLSLFTNNSRNYGRKYGFNLVNLDDETYFKSTFELPNCWIDYQIILQRKMK